MQYTIEPCIDADLAYKISVEVESYSGAKPAYLSGLPEDCYPAEDADIEYNIVQIITYNDEETQVRIADGLELPTRVDRDDFERELIELHESKLADDRDVRADYEYEERRFRR